MSSEAFERLKETVASFVTDYKNRISRKLKSAQTSGDESERLLAETERSIENAYRNLQSMEREVSIAPAEFRTMMNAKLRSLQRDVDAINREIKSVRPNQSISRGGGYPGSSSIYDPRTDIATLEERQRQQVMFGTDVLNRASESVARTQRVAAENEEIGVEILGELGTQREQLQRTSRKLDETKAELSRSRKLLNTMHRRVISNKILLMGIILFEVIILIAVIYIKFIK